MKSQPLREYRVVIVSAAQAPDLPLYPENLGLRTKFGGQPDGVQGNVESPSCPECGQPMSFIGQIDSFEHLSGENPNAKSISDQHFMFGDVGLIYVFFCRECLEAKATLQCF